MGEGGALYLFNRGRGLVWRLFFYREFHYVIPEFYVYKAIETAAMTAADHHVIKGLSLHNDGEHNEAIVNAETALALRSEHEGAMTLRQIARAVLQANSLGQKTMDMLTKNHPEVEVHVYGDPDAHVEQWNVMRVYRWVKEDMLYPQYAERFKSEEIDGELLILLNAQDLEAHLRVDSNLHRKKLLTAILRLIEEEKQIVEHEEEKETQRMRELLMPQPPGCPNLNYEQMKDALVKIGFDFSKYTKEHKDRMMTRIFKLYGHDPLTVVEWLQMHGAPAKLSPNFLAVGIRNFEDIIKYDIREHHLLELGVHDIKQRIRACRHIAAERVKRLGKGGSTKKMVKNAKK